MESLTRFGRPFWREKSRKGGGGQAFIGVADWWSRDKLGPAAVSVELRDCCCLCYAVILLGVDTLAQQTASLVITQWCICAEELVLPMLYRAVNLFEDPFIHDASYCLLNSSSHVSTPVAITSQIFMIYDSPLVA